MHGTYLRFVVIVLLVIFFAGCGDIDEYDYPGTLNVTGTGTAYAEPDIASIEFGVDITEKDPAEAVNQAAEMMDAAFAAASEYGIRESDMRTVSYNLWVEEEYDYNTYEYTGESFYHVSHFAQLNVRDLENVGDVLAALVGAGSNTIRSVTFKVEDTVALMDEARTKAAADASRIAEQLAGEIGMEIGDATYINEWIDYYPVGGSTATLCADFASEISAPSISPGTQSVTLKVQITFEMN
ncbi:MAG: SIMPL domain-containing protein [Candidatus Aegiribacteria sp.]|nr:SIMPL domain-containing protein [Candidatus Aegiribacteria sp.]